VSAARERAHEGEGARVCARTAPALPPAPPSLASLPSPASEWDIFHNFHKSIIGIGVLAIIVVLQIVLVEVGGDAFQTYPLTGQEWGVSIGLGLTSIPVGWVCRLIPIKSADDMPKGGAAVTPIEICCAPRAEASAAMHLAAPTQSSSST
jgi:hypothetical protein